MTMKRPAPPNGGITDLNRIYNLEELAAGEVIFAATGVTNGSMLKGVRQKGDRVYTESIVMRSRSGTVRYIRGDHRAK